MLSLRLRVSPLNLAAERNSPARYTKSTRSGNFRRSGIALPQFVGMRFQVLFHSPPGVLFTFPSRYLFTIGCQVVFSLARWTSQIPTGLHVSRGTQVPPGSHFDFNYGAFTLFGTAFQRFRLSKWFVTPRWAALQPPKTSFRVWAVPVSLATTKGIEFSFFSSSYLDVSVRWLSSTQPMCSTVGDGTLLPPGFPIRTSPDQRLPHLPEAYRSWPRPSSAPDTKAFTTRPLYLDHFAHL